MKRNTRINIILAIILLISMAIGLCIYNNSKKHPLVSVVIAAYNHEKYVKETIDSIVNQTYPNLEIIVIDDGSKDNTYKILQKLLQKHKRRFKRIVLRTQENQGTATTLNRLIKETKGKYVFMIASDDVAKPECIEKEVNFLEQNPNYAVAMGDNDLIDETSQPIYRVDNNKYTSDKNKRTYKTQGEFLKIKYLGADYFKIAQTKVFYTNGYTVRTSILKKIPPFTKEAPLEDYYMFLQILKFSKIKFIDEILFSYRIHDTQISKSKERMDQLTSKTIQCEEKLIKNLENFDGMLPGVVQYLKWRKKILYPEN